MPATATRDPLVVKLDVGDYVVPVGTGMHDMNSVDIFDVDPTANPNAPCYLLAALNHDHYAQIVGQRGEDELPRGRPMYFVRRRVTNNLELYPRCNQAYWLRTTFRKPIKYGSE